MSERNDEQVLLARFGDRPSAERAMTTIADHGPPVREVELLPPPLDSPRFSRRRLAWAVTGVGLGVLIGGGGAALLASLLGLEHGLLLEGPVGAILTGAIMGSLLIGALGLLTGLAVGEARAPKEVADREAQTGEIPGEALLRVRVAPGGDIEAVRAALMAASALSVREHSHSPWPDERVLATRRVREA